jgi:hypothetical protein
MEAIFDLHRDLSQLHTHDLNGVGMNKTKRKKAKATNLPPSETTEELIARLRAYADRTREQAMRKPIVPFPEDVTVLAGPLRKVRRRG